VRAVVTVEVRLQLSVPTAIEVDAGLDRVHVEDLDQRPHVGGRPLLRAAPGEVGRHPVTVGRQPATEVLVAVDHREPGTLDRGALEDHGRLGDVL